MNLYLTRAYLNKTAPVSAINSLLNPEDPNRKLDAHHKLIWTLFPGKDKPRDFLWRSEKSNCFYILSHRIPKNTGLFDSIGFSTKEFTPNLNVGDTLKFILRANATKDKPQSLGDGTSKKSQRVDLVMDKLIRIPGQNSLVDGEKSERANKRFEIAKDVAEDWITRKGKISGFSPVSESIICNDYSVRQFTRGKQNKVTFGILDISGIITISNPKLFLESLGKGFGRAKAYGCGLMLIRRA